MGERMRRSSSKSKKSSVLRVNVKSTGAATVNAALLAEGE
jgi:hypothetical protein